MDRILRICLKPLDKKGFGGSDNDIGLARILGKRPVLMIRVGMAAKHILCTTSTMSVGVGPDPSIHFG